VNRAGVDDERVDVILGDLEPGLAPPQGDAPLGTAQAHGDPAVGVDHRHRSILQRHPPLLADLGAEVA
jgi:hypothetical protein